MRCSPQPDSARAGIVEQLSTAFASLPLDQLDPPPLPAPPHAYERVTLRRDEDLEIAMARWVEGGQCELHGHDGSAALYTVLSGVVEEERYLPDGGSYRYEVAVMRTGDRSYLPPGSFHRVRALREAVTVHGYYPPPDHSTAEVPAAVGALLEDARSRVTARAAVVAEGGAGPGCRACPDVEATARALAEVWAEREARAHESGLLRMPPETLGEMRSSGILAAPVPEHLGGWGASLEETARAIRLVACRAPATALALVMPLGNAATTRIPAACVPPAVRPDLLHGQRWIAGRVARGCILAVANSEPGAGGDLANTKTISRLGADGVYRLSGRKSFATFGRDADYFLCAARRTGGAGGDARDVVDGFFVGRDAPGLVIDDRWNPVGMRPTASVGLTLDDVPAEAVLGYPGCLEGVSARHWSTVLFAAVFLGVGEGALREGVRQAGAAGAWARATLAEHALRLEAAAGFIESVSRDERWPLPPEAHERARRAKTFVARAAVEAATHAAMVSGGRCYTPSHPVFKFLCDALAGPLLRPPLPQAMDTLAAQLFAASA